MTQSTNFEWYVEAESQRDKWKFTKNFHGDRKGARKCVSEFVQKWFTFYDHDAIEMSTDDAFMFTDTERFPYFAEVKEYFCAESGDRVQLWCIDRIKKPDFAPFALSEGEMVTIPGDSKA